jgi:hypothetical protein
MRIFLPAILFLGSASAYCQDAGIMAAQQASQQAQAAAQQASQQAQAAAQQAMDQATITSQQSTINMLQITANASSSSSCPGPIIGAAAQPTFSVKSGKIAAGTKVILKSASHYAAIYYTIDGWAPNESSLRYTGPIPINAETYLQAIATGPNMIHSSIARAEYTVDPPAAPSLPAQPLTTDGVLRKGTTLRLVTGAEISSQNAQVGDKVPLLLDQEIHVNGGIMIPKGTSVDGILTVADPAAKYNVPGDLVFEVHSLNVQGKTIPLSGGETMEGAAARRPKEAIIEPAMAVSVVVTADVPLKQ